MNQKFSRPQIWGGIECTVNRLASGYLDQLELSGFYRRPDDIQAICDLSVKALRLPVLWEHHQPKKHQNPVFTIARQQIDVLSERGVEPILGLLHHGSGPEYTSLHDPGFPVLFAEYAEKVAIAFPEVTYYTPINEPLTTARFSGLYGLWFPHEKNDVSFARMFLNQIKATSMAMTAIRKHTPDAKLIQTEDFGKTYSTSLLSYQADWENLRRWLTWDLLSGKFDENHAMYAYFRRLGIDESELDYFIKLDCPPAILGVNYYITSERYLDHEYLRYPESTHGGNTIHQYADVEAVRVNHNFPCGFRERIREVWQRYQIPIAVTEVHLHCSREEQIRWLTTIYRQSVDLVKEGLDLRAVTAWSLLGSHGWSNLLTVPGGDYERGAFDVSSGQRRSTALAECVKSLAQTGEFNHHCLQEQGWWEKDSRFFSAKTSLFQHSLQKSHPVWILGKSGTLGNVFSKICHMRSLPYLITGRDDINLADELAVIDFIRKHKPAAIINATGYVRVDDAEHESAACDYINTKIATQLARTAAAFEIKYVAFSSDLVFDGSKKTPYVESDAANPLNNYGRSKAMAEQLITDANSRALIARTSAFFGPWDQYNFCHAVITELDKGEIFCARPEVVSPTYLPHLAHAVLDLMLDDEQGIWNLANEGEISWYDLAREVAAAHGISHEKIVLVNDPLPAARPAYSALGTEKSRMMPSLSAGLQTYFTEIRRHANMTPATSRFGR